MKLFINKKFVSLFVVIAIICSSFLCIIPTRGLNAAELMLEDIGIATDLSWVEGSIATASWNIVEGANYYFVNVRVYDGDVLLGEKETGTTSTQIDVQSDIWDILSQFELTKRFFNISFNITPAINIDDGWEYGITSDSSEIKVFDSENIYEYLSPSNLQLTTDMDASWESLKYDFETCYILQIKVVNTQTNEEYISGEDTKPWGSYDYYVFPEGHELNSGDFEDDGIHHSMSIKERVDGIISENNLYGQTIKVSFRTVMWKSSFSTDPDWYGFVSGESDSARSGWSEYSNEVEFSPDMPGYGITYEAPMSLSLTADMDASWESLKYDFETCYILQIKVVNTQTNEEYISGEDTKPWGSYDYYVFPEGHELNSGDFEDDGIHHSMSIKERVDGIISENNLYGQTIKVSFRTVMWKSSFSTDPDWYGFVSGESDSARSDWSEYSNEVELDIPYEQITNSLVNASNLSLTGDLDLNWEIPANNYETCHYIQLKIRDISTGEEYIIGEDTIPFGSNYEYYVFSDNKAIILDYSSSSWNERQTDGIHQSVNVLNRIDKSQFHGHELMVSCRVKYWRTEYSTDPDWYGFVSSYNSDSHSDWSEYSNEIRCKVFDDTHIRSIDISQDSPVLCVGNSFYLGRTVSPIDKKYDSLVWTSSNPSIVNVDQSGKITGVKPGVATVTVSYGYICDSVQVNVYRLDSNIDDNDQRELVSGIAGDIIDSIVNDDPSIENTDINVEDINSIRHDIIQGANNGDSFHTDIIVEGSVQNDYRDNWGRVKKAASNLNVEFAGLYSIEVEMYHVERNGREHHIGNITELPQEINFILDLPTGMPEIESGYTRKYILVRVHDGMMQAVEADVDYISNTLISSSSQFSDFILTYTDVPSVSVAEGGVAGFVERLYTVALGRASETTGKANWIAAIRRGESGADVAKGFLFSDEFLNKNMSENDFVTILYRTFFDREPDQAGLNGWVAALQRGESKQDVIMGFINSTEWANVCLKYGINSGGTGTPSITVEPNEQVIAFATRLYTTCLKRTPDQNGLRAWALQLANLRDTGSNAARGFFFSDEMNRAGISNEEFVTRLYLTFMDRNPDEGGFNAWVGQLNSGAATREEVFNGFAQSNEFGAICANYGIIR